MPQSGKSASVTGLVPGLHKVSVSGTIGGTSKRAEKTVSLCEGAVEPVTLTLA